MLNSFVCMCIFASCCFFFFLFIFCWYFFLFRLGLSRVTWLFRLSHPIPDAVRVEISSDASDVSIRCSWATWRQRLGLDTLRCQPPPRLCGRNSVAKRRPPSRRAAISPPTWTALLKHFAVIHPSAFLWLRQIHIWISHFISLFSSNLHVFFL